jgi:hypothetical protein
MAGLERKQLILVWNHLQNLPATAYGDENFGRGNYKIRVSRNPQKKSDSKIFNFKRKLKPIVYDFSGA